MPALARQTVAAPRVFWGAVWLAVVLVAIKASYLGVPPVGALTEISDYLRSLAAISSADVLFAICVWVVARSLLAFVGERPRTSRGVTIVFLAFTALSCAYALANVVVFGVFGGFLTYPLLALVGDVRMLSSSAGEYLTPGVVAGLVVVPLAYVGLVLWMARVAPESHGFWRPQESVAVAALGLWCLAGHLVFSAEWTSRQNRQIADNPQWVLVSSWWDAIAGENTAGIPSRFPLEDLADFAPPAAERTSPAVLLRRVVASAPKALAATVRPPLNVVVIVLESVAARWTGLSGGVYETTPNLQTESAHSLVFDNFYAHIGRSSNSLAAMLLSAYPKLDFRDYTDEFPHPGRTSLATVFRDRGYRTAFMMPSYLSWAGWDTFLQASGFTEQRDSDDFPCSPPLSSWGVEDRCMVDAMLQWMDENSKRPFFLVGWTDQTHHPYEPTPNVPLLNLLREASPDDWDLGRYLNILHETDRQLERLFEAIRRHGLANNTIVVVVGDHGQAFGYPHDSYMQGRTIYEEDVHVPLMIWSPFLYRTGRRAETIGSHVDLAPTIAALAELSTPADWQGRSLFDTRRAPRAYFYAAEDHFKLGVREGSWKYIFDLREGVDELYDLARDPTEQHNLVKAEPQRVARFRQRLAAWTEANRRQYERASQ